MRNTTSTSNGKHAKAMEAAATVSAGAPHVIHPTATYTKGQLIDALGLKSSTLRREVRERRLRVSRRAGKYYFLGAWVLEWIEKGEIEKP